MGPSFKISSISIELEGSTDNIETCDHFSIRGFVAERRDQERYQRSNCWPFPEGISEDKRSLSLPDLRPAPRQRRWTCRNCMRDLDPEGTIVLDIIATVRDIDAARTTTVRDGGLRTVPNTISERRIEGNSAVIPSQSTLPAVVVLDSENETEANVAGNNVEEEVKEDVNCDKSQKGNNVENKDGNSEILQKNDDHQKDTTPLKRAHPEATAPYNFRSRSRKRASPEQVGNKRSKEEGKKPSTGISTRKEKQNGDHADVTTTAIDSVRENTPPKETTNDIGSRTVVECETGPSESLEPSESGWQRRKSRKCRKRFIAELLYDSNGITEEPATKSKSRRGRKRKVVVPENENANGIVSPSGATAETDGESTDDPIRGKQKNRRFQVPDEPCEASQEGIRSAQPNDKLVDLALQDAAAMCLRDLRSSGTEVDVHSSSNNKTANTSPLPNLRLGQFPSSTDVTLQKDACGASSKGKTIMVQEDREASTSGGQDRKETTAEEREIAELMARNQYERSLANKDEDVNNKQVPPEQATEPKKKGISIDLNQTYNDEMSLEDNHTSEPPPLCDSDARKQDHLLIEKQHKSPEFVQVSHPYKPSPFGIFPPTQGIRASSSMGNPANTGQWLGNVPVMATHNPSSLRVLRGCETCYHSGQYRPQYGEVVYPLWPRPLAMMAPHGCPHMPFSYMNQSAVHSHMRPQAPGYRWNPTLVAAATENQRCGPDPAESSVPAINRARLRDPQLISQTPADHERSTMFTKRHFPPVSQGRDRFVLQTGESSKTAHSAMQSPFIFGSQFASEASRMSLPVIPPPPPGTSSFSYRDAQASRIQQEEKRQGMADKQKNQERQAETSNNNTFALPPSTNSGPMVCVVNRNPADFSIPEVGNRYMYGREDLEVRRRGTYKRKPALCKQDASKQNKKPV